MPVLMHVAPKIEVKTEEQALTLATIIADTKLVSFDTETTGIPAQTARLVVTSYCLPILSWNPKWGREDVFGKEFVLSPYCRFVFDTNPDICLPLHAILGSKDIDVIAHNWKYDAHIIHQHSRVIPGGGGKVFDTMQMDYLHDEDRRHGLKECCADYELLRGMSSFKTLFGAIPNALKGKVSESEYAMSYNREQFLDYAATDAYATLMLFEFLKDKLQNEVWPFNDQERTLWDYYVEYEEPFLKAVWEMERNGAYVVPETLAGYREPIVKRVQEIEGFYARKCGRVVNLRSGPQLQEMFEHFNIKSPLKTKTGNDSFDKEALEILSLSHAELIDPLVEYKKLAKLLSDYVEGLSSHILSDGRVHSSFNTAVAVTYRLSSSSPNLQNIANPSEDEEVSAYDIRRAFQAPPGRVLICCDFNQLEVLITAHGTDDENLKRVILEGLDLHAHTAVLMFKVDYGELMIAKKAENPTAAQKKLLKYRKAAKTLQFGILFGMGAAKLAKRLGVSLDEAKDYIQKYYDAYPGIQRRKKWLRSFCLANGFVLNEFGMRRRLPALTSSNREAASEAERQMFNSTIQGSASMLMRGYMPALVKDEELKSLDAKLVLQVHDEVLVESPKEHAERVRARVEKILSGSLPQIKWRVPLTATAKIGSSWSSAK